MNDSTSNNIFVTPLPWVEPNPLDLFPPQAPEPVPVDGPPEPVPADGLVPAAPPAVESLEAKEDESFSRVPASALTSSLTSSVDKPKPNRTPPPLPLPAPYPESDLPEMQDDDPLAPDLVPISAFPAPGEETPDPFLYVIPSDLPQGDNPFEVGNPLPSFEGEVQALGSISSIDVNGVEYFDDGVFLISSSDEPLA